MSLRIQRAKHGTGDIFLISDHPGEPTLGPFATTEIAQLELLTLTEKRLSPAQLRVWRVAHDATRAWWGIYGRNALGRLPTDLDVQGALLGVIEAVWRNSPPATIFKRAAGTEWRVWLARLEAA